MSAMQQLDVMEVAACVEACAAAHALLAMAGRTPADPEAGTAEQHAINMEFCEAVAAALLVLRRHVRPVRQ